MYSILEKKDSMVKFLADKDDDLFKIIDSCAPGSTVEVLGDTPPTTKHTFIKTPSKKWALYEGTSDFEIPAQDLEVKAATPNFIVHSDEETGKILVASDYQKGIQIHNTGLVTGVLKSAICPVDSMYPKDQQKGHYVVIEIPAEASTYDMIIGGDTKKQGVEADGFLMVRIENLQGVYDFK